MTTENTDSEQKLRNRLKGVIGDGTTFETSQHEYVSWAGEYEKDLLENGYSPHVAVSKKLSEFVPVEKRSSVRVLDVGAGTGLVAKLLRRDGFVHIDGLDPSKAMLDEAKKDNLYENYIVDCVTGTPSCIPADNYDAVTGSGIFGEQAHVPIEALHEMIRLVKPGGLVVLIARSNLLGPGDALEGLEPLMRQLVDEKKWMLLSRDVWERYYMNNDAVLWCYRVL